MTVLQARFQCDICGVRRTLPRRKIKKWEHCLEIKRGFKVKPVDICPKCQNKPVPPDRVFMRALFATEQTPQIGAMNEKYMA